MLFDGFRRCLYPLQRFQSDPERVLAVILENDADEALKWLKPAPGLFQIHYHADQAYEPDFVVETSDRKYILEPKRRDEVNDQIVQDKAIAAIHWCQNATSHETQHGGKPWSYILIPDDAILENATLAGLVGQFTQSG
jgi:type III restriction enzyme